MKKNILKVTRVLLGWTLLWAFIDKLFGLGFATTSEQAWINGGSPTTGFLTYATKGPFAEIYQALAGSTIVDILFMAGLLFVGISLIFNLWVKYLGWGGFIMMLLMYTAGFLPPEHNPVVDEHIIYAALFMYFALEAKGKKS